MKDAATVDISIGGPHLAAEAIRAGLVDEYWMLICPIIVGSGTPFLPDGVRVPLELLAKREFGDGALSLRYAVSAAQPRGASRRGRQASGD